MKKLLILSAAATLVLAGVGVAHAQIGSDTSPNGFVYSGGFGNSYVPPVVTPSPTPVVTPAPIVSPPVDGFSQGVSYSGSAYNPSGKPQP